MKVAVVILNYNGAAMLGRFLPLVVKYSPGADIVVADNASTDDSVAVAAGFSSVSVVQLDRNYGFADGYNKALAQIDAEYYLLLNSDVEVTEGWLAPLLSFMEGHPNAVACQPKILAYNNKTHFEYAGAAGGFIDRYVYPYCRGRMFDTLEEDKGQYDDVCRIFWATGAAMMVRSSAFHSAGGFDGRFFAHMEEIDLCWRMQLCGHKVTVVPQSLVYHVGGGTLPSSSPFKLFLNFRNNLLMLSNNLALTYALDCSKKGMEIENAARRGKRKAAFTIFCRMVLDSLSALVYALTLNTAAFRSVVKAHREYRMLKTDVSVKMITDYLADRNSDAGVVGIYRKWIVLSSMIKGDRIFGSINEKDFFKF